MLKNDGGILPLRKDADIAVIGAFAAEPRYQGAGSSEINPTRLDNALSEVLAHPMAGPKFVAAMAEVMEQTSGASALTAHGVDITRLIESFPIGRVGMFAAASGIPVDARLIDDILAAAN